MTRSRSHQVDAVVADAAAVSRCVLPLSCMPRSRVRFHVRWRRLGVTVPPCCQLNLGMMHIRVANPHLCHRFFEYFCKHNAPAPSFTNRPLIRLPANNTLHQPVQAASAHPLPPVPPTARRSVLSVISQTSQQLTASTCAGVRVLLRAHAALVCGAARHEPGLELQVRG